MYPVIKDVVAAATADKPVRIGEVNQDATALNIQERGLGFIDEMIKLCTADGKKVAVVGNEFYVNNCSDKGDEKTAEVIIEVGVPAQTTVDLAATEANKIMSKADTIAIFGSKISLWMVIGTMQTIWKTKISLQTFTTNLYL